MLKSIYIKDFAIIDELRIDFGDGFNVFTGETGAGKSIIVGALNFLRASRADVSYIRKGAKKAIIEGVFNLDDSIKAILDENEIEYDDELIVYRTLSQDSKNTIRVNNRSINLNLLSQIINDKIDIHSQKESHYLLNPNNQLSLVDTYMDDDKLLLEVKEKYQKYHNLKKEYNKYLDSNDSINDIEYYRFQIKEIEDANLNIDEEIELETISKRVKNSKKYIDHLNKAIELYSGFDGIDTKLYQAIKEIDFNDELASIHDNLLNKYYEIEDCFNELNSILTKIDISEDEINRVEERLYIINRLKRKYHGDINDILKLQEELKERIMAFDNRQEYIESFEKRITEALNSYNEAADRLTEKRIKAARKLSETVIEEVKGLELNYFDFKINFKKTDSSYKGNDYLEYMISTNKGEDLKPLTKVASGGEMSRVLLALKTIFSKLANVSLVVFDEIDTGVSGKAATAIGLKMAKISKYTQVLSITHLAQVASFADDHYYVSKKVVDDRTTSSIVLLEDDKRINELAMMSLSSTSNNSLEVAKELLNNAIKLKENL